MRSAACAIAIAALAIAAPASAQSLERFSLETTAAIDQFKGENTVNRPNIIIDITGSVRLGGGWQIYVRPWFRQPRSPSWDRQIYQAFARYERQGRVAMRVDTGYIGSPVGIGLADSSPSTNPAIGVHQGYFSPMQPFDTGGPRVNAMASTYPFGSQLTVSTERWDVRGAVVSSAPTRIHVINGRTNPRATPVIEGGAGLTPKTGVRLGVAFARGAYLLGEEFVPARVDDRQLTMLGVEGEYAFGYTKLSGEFVRDRFDTASVAATAYQGFIQGTHTLSPRWFVAGRHEVTSAPVRTNSATLRAQPRLKIVEATLGFRVTPEIMIRGSYYTRLSYGRPTWDHQGAAQLVWTRRWW